MANYYVSSVAYNAIPTLPLNTAISLGAIYRQGNSPAVNAERAFRVTTAGTTGASEATWATTSNATTTQGTAVLTECTGQEAHQQDNGTTTTWAAPAARLGDINANGKNVLAAGDTVFCSSDHAETQSTALTLSTSGSLTSIIRYISVSRTSGNVPPLVADITAGASLTTTGNSALTLSGSDSYWEGITFTSGSTASGAANLVLSGLSASFKNCAFVVGTTSATAILSLAGGARNGVRWNNCTVQFSASGQTITPTGASPLVFSWKNTASAIAGATLPTRLFVLANNSLVDATIRGVDLSALGSGKTLVDPTGVSSAMCRFSFRNCVLGSSVTLANTTNQATDQYIEFINCDSANTNYNCSWFYPIGQITTETTITRTSGASDGTTKYSRKMATIANINSINPLELHVWQWNTVTGSAKTATVEFISSGSLNNDEIWGELEYLADSGDCMSGFVDDGVATVLTTHAAQTSSSAAWDSSPATPQTQKMALTFTAQKAGLLHFVVKLVKASTTAYVDPLITVT